MAGKTSSSETPDEGASDRISMSVTIKRGRSTVHSITDFVTTPKVAGQMLKTIADDLDPARTAATPFIQYPPGVRGVTGVVTTNGSSGSDDYSTPAGAEQRPDVTFPPEG